MPLLSSLPSHPIPDALSKTLVALSDLASSRPIEQLGAIGGCTVAEGQENFCITQGALLLAGSGCSVAVPGDQVREIPQGDAVWLRSGTLCAVRGQAVLIEIAEEGIAITAIGSDVVEAFAAHLETERISLLTIWQWLSLAFESDEDSENHRSESVLLEYARSCIAQVLATMKVRIETPLTRLPDGSPTVLWRARHLLGHRCAGAVSRTDLAKLIGIGESTLTGHFHNFSRVSFSDRLLIERLHLARRLLTRRPRLQIPMVAESSGFSSTEVFIRAAKRMHGHSPLRLRTKIESEEALLWRGLETLREVAFDDAQVFPEGSNGSYSTVAIDNKSYAPALVSRHEEDRGFVPVAIIPARGGTIVQAHRPQTLWELRCSPTSRPEIFGGSEGNGVITFFG